MTELKAAGVKILGPPIYAMLALNDKNEIVLSEYAKAAKAAGLDLIGWSLERDGSASQGRRLYHKDRQRSTATATRRRCSMYWQNRSASARCSRTGQRRRRFMRIVWG